MIVKVEVFIYEYACFIVSFELGTINALCFENGREIFSIEGVMP